jgi:hypothetical protein
MKVSKRSPVAVVAALAAVLALLLLIGAASAQKPVTGDAAESPPNPESAVEHQRSALDNVDRFTKTLTTAGFSLYQGEFSFWDLAKVCCQGLIPDTLANNPWPNTYIALKLDDETAGMPGIDRYWHLREDEAIVLIGQTPPAAAYFSYQTVMITLPDDETTPDIDESMRRLGIAVGDTTNIGTVKTIGPDKYNRPIVYIITGNRETERRVRAAALKAGYPDAIINVETISPVIAPLGTGPDSPGSSFAFVHRVAVPVDKTAVEDYARHANERYRVFRVTPNRPLDADPEPLPVLRVRGTGHTEMALYPALKKLREAILKSNSGKPAKELDTKVWEMMASDGQYIRELKCEKPYVGLQRGIQVLGCTRDTNYLGTYPNFRLREGTDEFVIVYGVNHQKTGKATYSSFSIYADKDKWFGLKNGTTLSPNFDGNGPPGASARRYLPNDPDPSIDMLYAWKVARHCEAEDMPYCMEAKVNEDPDHPGEPFLDISDKPYRCDQEYGAFDLNQEEMFFLWRSYMEPATNVGPDDNELLYDRAIYFGPYFTEQ